MGSARHEKRLFSSPLVMILLILSPFALALPEVVTGPANAASNCTYDAESAAEFHHEINSFNLTGNENYYGEEIYYDDERPNQQGQNPWDFGGSLGDNIYNNSELDSLKSDFHTAFTVKNDTSTGLRVNLTSGYRYTFCVVTHSEDGSGYLESPMVDVYLLQKYDWDMYRNDYNMRVYEDRDLLNQIPPEWRDVSSWIPYRDVHSYERTTAIDFAVSLDHDEVSGGLFGFQDVQTEWMYLVIDGWDNMRDSDTPAPARNFTVDISVMTEERFTLPNYTVSLFCCGLFSMLVAAPVILHTRFQSAGQAGFVAGEQGPDLMPMLETEATKPQPLRPMQ